MTIDLFPTVARLIDAKLPGHTIDGLDIWPLLSGQPGAKNPHDAYFFYYQQNQLQAVRSGNWKLFFPHTARTMAGQPLAKNGIPAKYKQLKVGQELYDLGADPLEKADVADKHPEVVAKLTALADKARADLGDALTKQAGAGQREPGHAPAGL
jgi:arylsulfatase A-like enzyme